MTSQFVGVERLLTTAGLSRRWLLYMGRSAATHGITIQYCMAWPRHAMQALEIPVVTQVGLWSDHQNVALILKILICCAYESGPLKICLL